MTTNFKKYSLFIGRWQPPHLGHKTLIESVLKEGKNVCIAMRDTEINKDNPYSYTIRALMMTKLLSDWPANRIKIIKIPDIEEVCYGRKVGWGIREIKLSKKIENISATKIREKNKNINKLK